MNTDRMNIIARVFIVLLSAFFIGMILPFGLMQGTNAADLLRTRVMTGFFAPFMVAYLGKNVLGGLMVGSVFLFIDILLTLYIAGIVACIVSLRAKMALVFAILLASLWDILVLADCLLSHFD